MINLLRIARGFAALLLMIVALLVSAAAQTRDGHFRIGVMGFQPLPLVLTGSLAPVADELRKLGFVEGKNASFEVRSAEGEVERFQSIADELVGLNPDVILAPNTPRS